MCSIPAAGRQAAIELGRGRNDAGLVISVTAYALHVLEASERRQSLGGSTGLSVVRVEVLTPPLTSSKADKPGRYQPRGLKNLSRTVSVACDRFFRQRGMAVDWANPS